MARFVYSARLTKQGGVVVDLTDVGDMPLPDGVETFESRALAKAAWKRSLPKRRRVRMDSGDGWHQR